VDRQQQYGVSARFFRALEPTVAAELTATQRKAIEQALRIMSEGKVHAINVNTVFGLGRWRCYLVLLVGRDRRHSSHESGLWFHLQVLLTSLLLLLGLTGTLFGFYLIKSALGIDLFPHFSLGLWDWFIHLIT
jgi:hypothetical protein